MDVPKRYVSRISTKNILEWLESNQLPVIIFLSSFFILTIFSTTRFFISDEKVILNQFYNFIHGSLSFKAIKISDIYAPHLTVGNHLYGKFSYSLIILSLPLYYILGQVDALYSAHLFIVQLWALSGGVIVYLIAKNRSIKYPELAGALSYILLAAANISFFRPLPFQKWGELLSLEFTNIIISSFLILFIYLLFRNISGNKAAVFASFFAIFATPISFYAVSLKLHSLSLLLSVLAFYLFYKKLKTEDNRYMYAAYVIAGLCVWTRILDGAVLLISLLAVDIMALKRDIRYAGTVIIVILSALTPFFTFNYLIMDNPLSIMEMSSSRGETVYIRNAPNFIDDAPGSDGSKPLELKEKLGYTEDPRVNDNWPDVLLDITFLKTGNALGIFIVSPFLITALAFFVNGIKKRVRLNTLDMFFALYSILLVLAHRDYFHTIVTHTPDVLEYRYLLVMYVILLYFALRVDRVKELIENKLKTVLASYCILLILGGIYFIKGFPIPFMSLYYYAALIAAAALIAILLLDISIRDKGLITSYSLDNMIAFTAALSLALASLFILFYYWAVDMLYMSPQVNYKIIPALEYISRWVYGMVL